MNADATGTTMSDDDMLAEVAGHLDARSLTWQRTGDVIVLGFDGGSEDRADVTILIGPSGGGVLVEALTRVTVARERSVQVVLACNAWNGSARLPKATLVADEPDAENTSGRVVLESWLPVTYGLPDGYLAAFLDAAITGSCTFWHELDLGAIAAAD